jgi:hypothetical protein
LSVFVFAQYGNKGLRKSAFCKHATQQVGQFEGDKKSIGGHARAKHPGDDKIADEAEDTR